jgi:hypothetical protein
MPDSVLVGFKETKEVLDLVIALGRGVEESLEDDKLTLTDIPNFFPVLWKIRDAVEGVNVVPMEFKLASDEEAEELKQYLRDELDLADDQMEEFIEEAFNIVLTIWQVVKKFFLKGGEDLPSIEPQVTGTGDGESNEDIAPETPPVA